jgi:hypothetical protein
MILAKEITKWDVEYRQPNHTYLMNNSMSKIIGYFKWNNPKDFTKFKKPIGFDTRYRKFKILQRYDDADNKNRWKILGSKDNVYYVEKTDNGMSCTCIGFKYHGKCKHIDEVIRNESK